MALVTVGLFALVFGIIEASRYGLVNTGILAMGEFGAFFVLPNFLQAGLHLSAVQAGIWLCVLAFSPDTTFWQPLPGLVLHGIGIGFATSQLTNVVLSDIPPQKAGSASGAAGMVRQVGTALASP